MIYGDISEAKATHDRFFKRLGDNYTIKEIGTWDCSLEKILLTKGDKTYCALPSEVPRLIELGFELSISKTSCASCNNKHYIRFADFEIGESRAFYERKTATDFIASRRDRLYDQLNKMDTFIEGRKGLILEGMPRKLQKFYDSKNFFSGRDEQIYDLRGLSPLEQAITLGGRDSKNWTLSFIRECKMRDIEFVQTWDLDETIEFLIQCDEGYDETPKLRVIPKRYPDIPIAMNILVLFDGVGKVTAQKKIEQHGSLGKYITYLRKTKKSDMDKIDLKIKEVFGY